LEKSLLVYYAYELISGNNGDVDVRRESEDANAKLQQQYRRPARQNGQWVYAPISPASGMGLLGLQG
jgi:hypothetical protein